MSFTDEQSATEALQCLRNDSDPTKWILIGYAGSDAEVTVLKRGEGDLNETKTHLLPDEICYVVTGVEVKEKDYSTLKFVFLSWVGENTKPLVKARSSQHRLPIYKFCNTILQLSAELQSQDVSEINEDFLLEKLTMSKVKGAQETHTGATSATFHSSGGKSYGFSFADEAKTEGLVKKLPKQELNWVTWGYNEEDGPLVVLGSGSGDLAEVKGEYSPEKVVYTVLGMKADDAGVTTTKFILITWVGPDVKPLHKARSSQHRVELYTYIKRHVQLQGEYPALRKEDLTEQLLLEKLTLSKDRDQEALRVAAEIDAKKRNRSTSHSTASSFRPEEAGDFHVPWANEEEAVKAIKECGDVSTHTTWVVFGYEGASKDVSVLHKGDGNIQSFQDKLFDDQLHYILFSAIVNDEDYSVYKNCFISWVGANVKPMLRARSSQHRVPLYNFINKNVSLAAELQVLTRDDLTEENVHEKFTGSRYADASTSDKAVAAVQRTRTNSATPKTAGGDSTKGFSFVNEAAADEKVKALHSSDGSTAGHWVLFVPSQGKKDVIEVGGTGSGGLGEFQSCLKADEYSFVILAVQCADECGGDYAIVKNLFIAWVGPDVKPLTKARSSQHRVALYTHCKRLLQMHGELQVQSMEELTDKTIQQKLAYSRQV